jgi:hypothetical protein
MGEWCLELVLVLQSSRNTTQIFKYFAFFSMIFFSVLIIGGQAWPKKSYVQIFIMPTLIHFIFLMDRILIYFYI